MLRTSSLAVVLALGAFACGSDGGGDGNPAGPGEPGGPMGPSPTSGENPTPGGPTDPTQPGPVDPTAPPGSVPSLSRHKAELLTSLWENSTTVLQYGFSENNNDGRGYTSGRAGFCSGTGDAILVVKCFDAAFGTGGQNAMHKYVPALTTIEQARISSGQAQGGTGPLDAVGNYNTDWKNTANLAATSAAFRKCQDDLVQTAYFEPAVAIAKQWGLPSPLAMALLYDATIMHGEDGARALAAKANTDTGNAAQTPRATPMSRDEESAWIEKFVLRRLATMKTDSGWVHSVDRTALYEKLRREGNFLLDATIVTDAKAVQMYPQGGFLDSGYPKCTIAPNGDVSGDPECTAM